MRLFNTSAAVIVLVLALAAPAFPDPLTITPYVSVRQEYSDNILFSEGSEKTDYITTASAGLDVEKDTERLDARFRTQFDQLLYWRYDELDALDYDVDGDVSCRVTERLGARAGARYKKDSRADRDTDTTGLLVEGDRKTATLDLGTDYMISEIQNVDLGLEFERTEREKSEFNEDNDTFSVLLSFNRNLSEHFENTTGILNLNFLHYTSESDDSSLAPFDFLGDTWDRTQFRDYTSDIFQFSTGFSHDITELYNVFFLAGASYTETDEKSRVRNEGRGSGAVFDSFVQEFTDDTVGGVLSTGVNYEDIYNRVNLTLSQDVRGGTGTSGAVQRTSLSGSYRRRMTEDFSLTLNASVYKNKNERSTAADTDELTFNISPGFRYRITRDFVLSGAYRFTSVEDRTADTTKERSLVYLLLKKEFEL